MAFKRNSVDGVSPFIAAQGATVIGVRGAGSFGAGSIDGAWEVWRVSGQSGQVYSLQHPQLIRLASCAVLNAQLYRR